MLILQNVNNGNRLTDKRVGNKIEVAPFPSAADENKATDRLLRYRIFFIN